MGVQSAVVFSEANAPVENCLVGNQNVTVIVEPAGTSLDILTALIARVSELEQREVTAWTPRLRNLATQILLHACGKQEFRTAFSNYFAKLVEAKDSGLAQVAGGMGMELAVVGKEADDVLMRRNRHVHPGSLESLEAEVNVVRSCITPALEKACPQECRFVRAYEVIKRAFPERFT